MPKPYRKVVSYFSTLESKFGYDLVLGGVKHFGYYPSDRTVISEKKAQFLMMDLVAEKLKPEKNSRILEAGCGQGITAIYLAKNCHCNSVGISVTPFEIEKAKALAKKERAEKQSSFYLMDYTRTDFPADYFDSVYTLESLVHAYDLEKTLRELKRILKPGKKIAFFEYSMAPDDKIYKFMKKTGRSDIKAVFAEVIDKGAMYGLNKLKNNELPKILAKTGFTRIREDNILKNVLPSMRKLHNLARLPFIFVKLFRLKKYFFNTWVAAEFFPILFNYPDADLFRYNITTAQKP